jgi:pimeloyl-ACP methyl ester carboxylesterase
VVLIMGLGTQLIAWPDELCSELARRGYFVVRFDNRDTGRSTHLVAAGVPNPARVLFRGEPPPYRIEDMALDTIGLLDALGLESAHLVGASMGGFIVQETALARPERVRSLVLIMTSTGSPRVGMPNLRIMVGLGHPRHPDATKQASVELVLEVFSKIGSPGYPRDEAYLADLAGRSFDRAYDPAGYARQVAAILAQRDRSRRLRNLELPTTVLHGLSDPLVNVSGGRALARAIPGARFVGLPGMGHDLPRPLWGRFVDEIDLTASIGERSRAGAPGPDREGTLAESLGD